MISMWVPDDFGEAVSRHAVATLLHLLPRHLHQAQPRLVHYPGAELECEAQAGRHRGGVHLAAFFVFSLIFDFDIVYRLKLDFRNL